MTNTATDIEIYRECMTRVRDRVRDIWWLTQQNFGERDYMRHELFGAHFRKVLELIAFASLAANKSLYAQKHKNFDSHWKAVKMLEALEKINPDFYPKPVGNLVKKEGGGLHLPSKPGGYLTRDDFVELY